jgi:hypothetical protein
MDTVIKPTCVCVCLRTAGGGVEQPAVEPEVERTSPKQGRRHSSWDTHDKELVLSFFDNHFKSKIVPGKAECDRCIASNTVLGTRSWRQIKWCVYNKICTNRSRCTHLEEEGEV